MNNTFENPNASVYEKLGIYEKPFELIPDYRFSYFPSKSHILVEKTLELMDSRASNILINGESGIGKTTLARRIEFKLNNSQNHFPIFITTKRYLHSGEFWKNLVRRFNIPSRERPENNWKMLSDFLYKKKEIVYIDLLIDDAELMNDELANTLAELDGYRINGNRLLQMILFMTTQESPRKIGMSVKNFELERFDFFETRRMIEYRLFISSSPQIFSEMAMERIYGFAHGNPRKIVNWCQASLEYISQVGKTFIDQNDIDGIYQLMNYSQDYKF